MSKGTFLEESKIIWIDYSRETIDAKDIAAIELKSIHTGEYGEIASCVFLQLGNGSERRLYWHRDPQEAQRFLNTVLKIMPLQRRTTL